MNTNWAKILLFSLIAFALGFVISCLTCGPCMGRSCGGGSCGNTASCQHGGGCGHQGASCGHGRTGGACCKGEGHGDHGRAMHPGDAEADRLAKQLEEAGFIGDTTVAIDGGQVRIVRSAENTSVHVDMQGHEH